MIQEARVLMFAVVLAYPTTAQTDYTFTSFAVPNSTYTNPTAINDHGEIVGFSGVASQTIYNGFLRNRSGGISILLYPGSTATSAYGINKSGVIVGSYLNGTMNGGYFYQAGTYTNVVVNGQPASLTGINDYGFYVGDYGSSPIQAFEASPTGQITFLRYPGGYRTGPTQIKDNGDVIGTYLDRYGRLHTFLYNPASGYKTLSIPGKPGATIGDVNSAGVMVGSYFNGKTVRAFVYAGGTFQFLEPPDANDSSAVAINNLGDIVGAYTNPSGMNMGFIARPSVGAVPASPR